jgi:uncharacterized protein
MTTAEISAVRSPPIAVTPEQWETVAEILRRYAGGRPVWAYGSRARGSQPGNRIKRYSDLDLIVGGEPFRGLQAWGLEEAFDESRLPFRVEFQHEAELSAEFRERIEKDFVVVQGEG